MRLWTVQSYNVYEVLRNTGIYRCNSSLSSLLEENEFVNAYKWISKKMKDHIGNPPDNVTFPVWAWYKVDGQHRRPDMRTFGMRVFEKSVLMEIEIPENQVLLSDFDYWHLVLNDTLYYKASSMENISNEEWDAETDKEDAYYSTLSLEEKQAYKEKSWEKIFSIDTAHSDFVQATFWELKKEQIKKIWVLKGFQRK